MLDINFIRQNQELVTKSAQEKGYHVNISELLQLDDQRRELLQKVDELRRQRNEISAKMGKDKPEPEVLAAAKEIKSKLATEEPQLNEVEQQLKDALKQVPNIIFDDVPLGGEECSIEVKQWGGQKSEGVDHLDYALSRDWGILSRFRLL